MIKLKDLMQEKAALERIIEKTEERLKNAPPGTIHIIKHGNGYQYYQRNDPSEKSGIYLPVKQHRTAMALIQKKYDLQVLKAAKKQYGVISRFLTGYHPECLRTIHASLSEAQKENVIPVELSDEEFIKRWQALEYTGKDFDKDAPEHYTDKGERVRSKSEVMIANALKQANIPYRYEFPIDVGGYLIHPDFTILRIKDRHVLYWEHLGRMDEPGYCNDTLWKMRRYEKNGILPGVNLILTMEAAEYPINTNIIWKMIETYCI